MHPSIMPDFGPISEWRDKCLWKMQKQRSVALVVTNTQNTAGVAERAQMQPPRFVERMKNYTIVEGQSVSLTCHAEGVPTPMMSWQKDNKMITPNRDYK